MKKILNYPLIFCLKVKCGFLGVILKAAKEQTADARKIAELGYELDGCVNEICAQRAPEVCRLKVFKEREAVIWAEILDIRERIARLRGTKA